MKLNIIKNLSSIGESIGTFTNENKSTLLLSLGVAGLIGAGISAVAITPKVIKLMDDKKDELDVDELTVEEKVTTGWKYYVIPVTMTAISIGLIVYSQKVQNRRIAALATAYSISESTLVKYQEKIKEIAGNKTSEKVEDEVAKACVNEKKVPDTVIVTNHIQNGTLFFDSFTGVFFPSDMDTVKSSVIKMNTRLMDVGMVSLEELYDDLDIQAGSVTGMLGWDYYDRNSIIEVKYSAIIKDNKPCIVLTYRNRPKPLVGGRI